MRWIAILALVFIWAEDVPAVNAKSPILIAHRGASGDRPEHTLAAYSLAIEKGADFIEPDLVLTQDGVLVARHENDISGTTDVASKPEYASRRTTKSIDGQTMTGWFTEDFTLAELRTLRARERIPELRPANRQFDGQFTIPTFDDIVALAKEKSRETGRTIGIYPETKHPSYFASIGIPHEAPLIEALKRAGWTGRSDPVFIQSFEVGNLRSLSRKTKLRLIQLVDANGGPADLPERSYAAMVTPEGLRDIASYAQGIGPAKSLVIARTPEGGLDRSTGLVASAHAVGLAVHPWTFRAENVFLPADMRSGIDPAGRGDLAGEIRAFMEEGVDGLFSDHVAEARAAFP